MDINYKVLSFILQKPRRSIAASPNALFPQHHRAQGYLISTLSDLDSTLFSFSFLAVYLPSSRAARALLWPPGRMGDLALVSSHVAAFAVAAPAVTYVRNERCVGCVTCICDFVICSDKRIPGHKKNELLLESTIA